MARVSQIYEVSEILRGVTASASVTTFFLPGKVFLLTDYQALYENSANGSSNRNRQAVQRCERLRLHHDWRGRGCVRPLQRDSGPRLQLLQEGAQVEFDVIEGPKGLQGANVRIGA